MPDELNLLVARAQSGEAAALDRLVSEVRVGVLRYALARRLGREDADDLAQEVCVAVIKVVPGWQENGRSMWGYVFTVARNLLADGVRRQVREGDRLGRKIEWYDDRDGTPVDVVDAVPGPEETALARAGSERMQGFLDQLPDTQRDVLVLRAVVGLSGRETAEALNLSPGSVHVLQHRAVSRLRDLMARPQDAGVEQ